MKKLSGILAVGWMALAAGCIGTSDEGTSDEGLVSGSEFRCTGNWPSTWNPCDYPWSSRAATAASIDQVGMVELTLHRVPVADDGGGSTVYIHMPRGPAVDAVISAREVTLSPEGDARIVESSDAISVSVHPVVASLPADGREAGRFSVTFQWGAIDGTYDTDPAP